MRSSAPEGTPGPASRTRISTPAAAGRLAIVTASPGAVCWTAFSTRASRASISWSASAMTIASARGPSDHRRGAVASQRWCSWRRSSATEIGALRAGAIDAAR
jgi:hypothetical protein